MKTLQCEMHSACSAAVTHVGDKGFIYCSAHASARRGYERCRKLRQWECVALQRGEPISYVPGAKPKPAPVPTPDAVGRVARLEKALRDVIALAPDTEPEPENYDDTESAFNNGTACAAWDAAEIARKALRQDKQRENDNG